MTDGLTDGLQELLELLFATKNRAVFLCGQILRYLSIEILTGPAVVCQGLRWRGELPAS